MSKEQIKEKQKGKSPILKMERSTSWIAYKEILFKHAE
jgi:hypothetical protein